MTKFKAFLKKKDIVFSGKRYFIDSLGAMALGLFASLLIGTIFQTIAQKLNIPVLDDIAKYATGVKGAAMAVAIGSSLNAPSLVLLSLAAVGLGADTLGGPTATWICVVVACELGKLVSKETKIDILITPTVTIISGSLLAILVGPAVSYIMNSCGKLIMNATELEPFFMGIVVSVVVGMLLTLPISSAAICAALSLTGLAGGAATAGCCAQMIGFAVMRYRENKMSGLLAQGLGTSMLQMGNIVKNPRIWIPTIITSAITGPISTCVFKMENYTAVASGMGTCGLVGPIGVMSGDSFSWVALIMVCFVLPAVITPLISELLRKIGWIKDGDLNLNL